MMTEIERRQTKGTVELRGDESNRKIGGYAIIYNSYSQNLGGYVEECSPGLADKSIADRVDVLCRTHHDSTFLLGRILSETLRLVGDGTGVDYEADLPDTSYARDLAALAKRGDVRHSSFAFRVPVDGDEWSYTEQGYPLRILRSVLLVDVAPVVSPAYLDTTSGLRSLAEQRNIDLGDVTRAAEANQLGELMRARDPKIIDVGGQGATHPLTSIRKRQLELLERK